MPKVSLSSLKTLAIKLPDPVKSMILSEPDELEAEELIVKYGDWSKLLTLESKKEA